MRLTCVALFIGLVAAACQSPNDRTTLQRVADGPELDVAAGQVVAEADVAILRDGAWEVVTARSLLTSGVVAVSADPNALLTVDRLMFRFDDLVVGQPGASPPDGLHLTHFLVSVPVASQCEHIEWTTDDQECRAHFLSSLEVTATMVRWRKLDVPVTAVVADAALEIDLAQSPAAGEANVALALRADAPGVLWSWGDAVELREFRLNGATGYASDPAAD